MSINEEFQQSLLEAERAYQKYKYLVDRIEQLERFCYYLSEKISVNLSKEDAFFRSNSMQHLLSRLRNLEEKIEELKNER